MRQQLQLQIDQASHRSIIHVPPGDHAVNLIIERPVILRGSGSRTRLVGVPGSGPVIWVEARGVSIESLSVEHVDAAGYAIAADPRTEPLLNNVDISGHLWNAALALRPITPPVRTLDLRGAFPTPSEALNQLAR